MVIMMSQSDLQNQLFMDQQQLQLCNLLQQLGLTANYIGFTHISDAVCLCAVSPKRLQLVTKLVYSEVARTHGTTWRAVERNIRNAGTLVWEENRPLLEHLAGRSLTHKPCSAQLLAILALWLLNNTWESRRGPRR